MSTTYRTESRRERHRHTRLLQWWNRFVMLVGYAVILYELARGVIYLLVLLGGTQ